MKKTISHLLSVLSVIFFLSVFASGCKTVSHMDQLLLLKSVSDEQAEIGEEVELSDQRFESLVKAVETEEIVKYKNEREVKEQFGLPIFSESISQENKSYQRWLYRYSTQFFGSKKVYLYFDNEKKLIKWEYVE